MSVELKEGSLIRSPNFTKLVKMGTPNHFEYNPREGLVYMELYQGLAKDYKLVKGKIAYGKPLFDKRSIDETRADALWEVVKMVMTGGGYAQGNDYYPDAWHITAKRTDKDEWVHFTYDTNCYITAIQKHELEVIEQMPVLFNHKGDLYEGFQEDIEYILDECVERVLNRCEGMVAAYDINRIPQPELNAVRMQLSMMITQKFTTELSKRKEQRETRT